MSDYDDFGTAGLFLCMIASLLLSAMFLHTYRIMFVWYIVISYGYYHILRAVNSD